MPWLRLLRKIAVLLRRESFDQELQEEMAFHREQAAKEFEAGGITPEAARYAAMRQFGNATLLKERSHEVMGFRAETVMQDLRFAVRQLRRSPGLARDCHPGACAGHWGKHRHLWLSWMRC